MIDCLCTFAKLPEIVRQ